MQRVHRHFGGQPGLSTTMLSRFTAKNSGKQPSRFLLNFGGWAGRRRQICSANFKNFFRWHQTTVAPCHMQCELHACLDNNDRGSASRCNRRCSTNRLLREPTFELGLSFRKLTLVPPKITQKGVSFQKLNFRNFEMRQKGSRTRAPIHVVTVVRSTLWVLCEDGHSTMCIKQV